MTTEKEKERQLWDYIRVTEVLDPYFDKTHIPPDVLENAKQRGSAVHDAIEMFLKGLGTWIDPEYQPYMKSFKAWMDVVNFKSDNIVCLEKRMWDDKLMLTGQCDLIYNEGGEDVLIDFKTSHSPSKSWALQLGAYAYLSDVGGLPVDRSMVLHLQKDGKPARVHEYENQWELFKKAYDVYVHFNPKKLKGKKK